MLKEKIMFLEKLDRIHFHTFDAGDDGTSQILDLMRLVIAVVDHSVEISPGLQFVGGNTNVFCRFLPGEIVFSCDITQPLWMDRIETPSRTESRRLAVAKGIAPPLYPPPKTTPTTGNCRFAISEMKKEMLWD